MSAVEFSEWHRLRDTVSRNRMKNIKSAAFSTKNRWYSLRGLESSWIHWTVKFHWFSFENGSHSFGGPLVGLMQFRITRVTDFEFITSRSLHGFRLRWVRMKHPVRIYRHEQVGVWRFHKYDSHNDYYYYYYFHQTFSSVLAFVAQPSQPQPEFWKARTLQKLISKSMSERSLCRTSLAFWMTYK